MKLFDINSIKKSLRQEYKSKRAQISNDKKKSYDDEIFLRLISFAPFIKADTVLCFVSTLSEVDTHNIISHCLNNCKKVAVPKCLDNNGNMDFFYISSLDNLQRSYFDLLEPDISKCEKVTGFNNAVCIVPGLVFDKNGYRIGYGKGYYDRFLSKTRIKSIGLVYQDFVVDTLPYDRYDMPVDFIITEKDIIRS